MTLLERLNKIETEATLNGLALAKLQASCELDGYASNRERIDELSRNTDHLLKEMKVVRLLCNINEN